jgi:hypothetical protein
MKNPNKKNIEGYQTLNSFFEQFGDRDVYTMIVLEEVFKEIYGTEEHLHISGEAGQEGRAGSLHVSRDESQDTSK